jgi:hypothetical protein
MSNLWIRLVYALLLALVVALTVGFAITMALPGPRPPDTPSLTFRQLQSGADDTNDADKLIGVVDRFYQDAYDFRRAYPAYQRNLLLASVLLGAAVAAIGIGLSSSFNYLRVGLTLGSVLIFAYGASVAGASIPNPAPTASPSITNLLAAGSPPGLDFAGRFLRFAASFVALLVLLFMGLWRLTDWAPSSPSADASIGRSATAHPPGAIEAPPSTLPVVEQGLWKRPGPESD